MSNEHLYKRGVRSGGCAPPPTAKSTERSLYCRDAKTARRLRRQAAPAEITAAAYHGRGPAHMGREAVTEWASHALGQLGRTTSKRYA